MGVNYFRLVSLISIQYKITSKLLALRLPRVVETVVSVEQTAFVKGRQILDGPLLVNRLLDWRKSNIRYSIRYFLASCIKIGHNITRPHGRGTIREEKDDDSEN